MSVASGPKILTTGLVLNIDMNNTQKSWRGAPTTNYITNPTEEMVRGEFGQYRDLAPTFNTYGLVPYSLSMDIKVNKAGSVLVYMQNGSSTKYGFVYASVNATTEYQRFYFNNITPSISTPSDTAATLATYTGYGSGINPTVRNIQLELGSFATPFVIGSRSSNQSIIDLTGTYTVNANSLTYGSDNTFSFNGASSNNATITVSTGSTNTIGRTWEAWVTPGTSQTTAGLFGSVVGGGCTYYCNGGICIASGKYQFNWYDNAAYQFLDSGVVATSGVTAHVVGVWDGVGSNAKIYINGVLTATGGVSNLNYGGGVNLIQIGYLSASGNYYTGKINSIKHYFNYALSATEVAQNYASNRTLYGLN